MNRFSWTRAALLTTLVGASGYAAYSYSYPSKPDQETFNAWIRVSPSKKEMRAFPLLPHPAIQGLLTQHVRSSSLILNSGRKWAWNVAQVSSNDPMEDSHAELVLTRDDAKVKGEMLFFAVMDGHAGPWTSQLLSRTLIPTVVAEMDALIKGLPSPLLPPKSTFLNFSPLLPAALRADNSASPTTVAQALKRAYTTLDRSIVASALGLLDMPPEKRPDIIAPFLRPALSGSCALLAVLDTFHEQVHVALVGDCRAVAGYYDPLEKRWIAETLTEDQTAKATAEIERLQKEHPGEEEMVARNGRVLGGLEPSRAFGDARYKWTAEQQERINEELITPPDRLVTPPTYKTPPYVTAEPVVTNRPFTLPSTNPALLANKLNPKSPSSSAAPTLRFLILATDGLWDVLNPLEAVTIASTHLSSHVPSFPSSTLPPVVGNAGVEGKGEWRAEQEKANAHKEWVYDERDTPAVCLIRNALGGHPERVRRMLSMRAPYSRRERDDMTVTVVWWEEAGEETPKAKL